MLSVRNSGAQAEKPGDIEGDSRTLVSPKQPFFLQRLQDSFAESTCMELLTSRQLLDNGFTEFMLMNLCSS